MLLCTQAMISCHLELKEAITVWIYSIHSKRTPTPRDKSESSNPTNDKSTYLRPSPWSQPPGKTCASNGSKTSSTLPSLKNPQTMKCNKSLWKDCPEQPHSSSSRSVRGTVGWHRTCSSRICTLIEAHPGCISIGQGSCQIVYTHFRSRPVPDSMISPPCPTSPSSKAIKCRP